MVAADPSAIFESLPARLGAYEVERRLGAGGMGVVFEARDLERDRRVALKLLPDLQPDSLQRFKSEFRTVEHLAHPNLATVYELISFGNAWFFTMELIDGINFKIYLNRDTPSEERMRRAFEQLALGVYALHEAGLLHLDLKPANVLAEPSGRVVLVDFGLVQTVRVADRARRPKVAGTPEYMSPEQARGEPPTTASDWYALGVMMFEALTGELPFRSAVQNDLLFSKVTFDPPKVLDKKPTAPRDLAALCDRLLSRDVSQRPAGLDVLAALGVTPTPSAGQRPALSPSPSGLIGRRIELAVLEEGYGLVARDRPVSVLVHGPSGIGKSSLLRGFREWARRRSGALVLSGRCYERETLPFKAFDSVIDALSDHLKTLPEDSVEPLLPPDVDLVAKIFPVLQGVPQVRSRTRRFDSRIEARELQRRAFRGLKELLARVAKSRKLLVLIDDLQWGDQDSARLLSEILSPPDEPGLMLIGSFRSEEADGPFLKELRRHWEKPGGRSLRRVITLGPLSESESRQVAAQILGPDRDAAIDAVAKEASGNPLLVEQLAEAVAVEAPVDRTRDASLTGLLLRRVDRLLPEARRLLEVVAIAGKPITQRVAIRAAALGVDSESSLALLRSSRLVRTRGARDLDAVECYHDRIRETVAEAIRAEALVAIHRSLAEAIEAGGAGAHDELALHWHGAGKLEKAAKHARMAAAEATETLAFDRAAELYARALEWGASPPDERCVLLALRAEALVNAGHTHQAAAVFLDAARDGTRERALVWRRQAAEQELVSGHVDEGVAILRELMGELGLRYPESPRMAVLGIFGRMLLLRLRGLAFEPRSEDRLPADQVARIDLSASAAKGLIAVDSVRGAYFCFVSLLHALKAGEPRRIGRAMALVGGVVLAAAGGGLSRWGQRMLEQARGIAESTADPYLNGLTAVCLGQISILNGQWTEVVAESDRGVGLLRESCRGVAWECDAGRMGAIRGLEELGRLSEAADRAKILLREAEDRGDLYPRVTAALYAAAARLAGDDVAGARQLAEEARSAWSQRGFHVQHFYALRVEAWCDLYEGKPERAWDRIQGAWSAIRHSHLLQVPVTRADALLLRAQAAIASAAGGGDRQALTRIAARDARSLAAEDRPDLAAHAALLRAGLAALDGAQDEARDQTGEAVRRFYASGMIAQWAAAQLCWAQLSGVEEAASSARELLREAGVEHPDRWAALRAPGLIKL